MSGKFCILCCQEAPKQQYRSFKTDESLKLRPIVDNIRKKSVDFVTSISCRLCWNKINKLHSLQYKIKTVVHSLQEEHDKILQEMKTAFARFSGAATSGKYKIFL